MKNAEKRYGNWVIAQTIHRGFIVLPTDLFTSAFLNSLESESGLSRELLNEVMPFIDDGIKLYGAYLFKRSYGMRFLVEKPVDCSGFPYVWTNWTLDTCAIAENT